MHLKQKINHSPITCPDCSAPLVRDEELANCDQCKREFVPRSGVHNLWPKINEQTEEDLWWEERFDKLVRERGPDTAKVCEYYDEESYSEKKSQLIQWMGPQKNKRLIDIGCGPGLFAKEWVNDNDVVGVDQSFEMVSAAASRGLEAFRAPADNLPFPDSTFDGAVLIEILQAVSRPMTVLKEAVRVVKPGGVIMMSTHNGASLVKRMSYALLHHKNKLVRRLLSPVFPYHDGPAHLTFTYRELERELAVLGCREVTGQYFYLPTTYRGPAGGLLQGLLAPSLAVRAVVG